MYRARSDFLAMYCMSLMLNQNLDYFCLCRERKQRQKIVLCCGRLEVEEIQQKMVEQKGVLLWTKTLDTKCI